MELSLYGLLLVIFHISNIQIIFIKVRTLDSKKLPYFIGISSFLSTYYLIVKLTGEFAYNIRWFPYIIFDAKSFGQMLGISNYPLCVILLIICCIILFILYFTLYLFLLKQKISIQNSDTTSLKSNKKEA